MDVGGLTLTKVVLRSKVLLIIKEVSLARLVLRCTFQRAVFKFGQFSAGTYPGPFRPQQANHDPIGPLSAEPLV